MASREPPPSAYEAATFFDLSLDMLCIAGTDGRFRKVNPAFERTLGWSREDLLRRPFYDLVHPDDIERTRREMMRLAEGFPTISFENRYACADGGYKYLLWTAQPVTADGLVYAVARDITHIHRHEEELTAAKERAEAAARTKAEFLADMSHEIRTPMSAIIGMAELALESARDEPLRNQLQTIRQSAESLLLLMHDILDLSKAEAGKLELLAEPFSLRATLGDAIKIFAVEARRKGLELLVWIDPDLPDGVVGDAVRLRQVVLNLVGNATKFTERGRISVEVEEERAGAAAGAPSEPGERVVLHVCVRDTGIGIPEDKRAAIFESFTQADGATQHRFGGTGLGLAICARLVDLMGGRIWVESEVGVGSVFHFTAPVSIAEAPSATAGAGARRGAPLLLLDDPEAQRAILRRSLEEWGIHVVEAPSAVEARRVADDRARAGTDGDAGGAAVVRAADSLRILLAEDSLVNQRVTAGLLEARGHRVDVVGDGIEAIAATTRRRYDLVLMDVQMPEMGGIEATAAIRAREATEGGHLPIVALTARAMGEDRERCFQAGMDGYLAKPLRHAELLALAEGLTAGRRSAHRDPGRPAHRSAARPGALPPPVALPQSVPRAAPAPPREPPGQGGEGTRSGRGGAGQEPALPQGGPVDWSAALEGVDGDLELLGRIVDATLEEAPLLLDELRREAARRDGYGLARAAHKLEGSLRCVHDAGLIAVAEDLEDRARHGDLDRACAEAAELEVKLAPVLAALRDWRSGST